LLSFASGTAAELRIRATTLFKPVFDEVSEEFKKKTGDALLIQYGPGPVIEKALRGGERCDVVIGPFEQVSSLAEDGLLTQLSPFAEAQLAVGVKPGGAGPDLSSEEAFRASVARSQKIAYSAGLSGSVFVKNIEKAGIVDILRGKAVVVSSEPVGALLMRGEADFGIQQNVELLAVPGIRLVGELPGQFGAKFPNSIGLCRGAQPSANTFVTFVRSEAAARVLERNGWRSSAAR
jgi:molybdate transport system substrate-binding protein